MHDRALSTSLPGPHRPDLDAGDAVWRTFDELTVSELYGVLRLRCEIFVVEQNCAYADIDGADPAARHLLVWRPDGAALAGCLRLFGPGPERGCARIGRVATALRSRRTGLGRWMMREAFAEIARRFGSVDIEISAQVAVEPFYLMLGFKRVSAEFLEDGIAHCLMRRGAIGP